MPVGCNGKEQAVFVHSLSTSSVEHVCTYHVCEGHLVVQHQSILIVQRMKGDFSMEYQVALHAAACGMIRAHA